TFYVSSGLLGKTGYLTKEQVIELSQKGNEIGSHCVTHRDLKKLSWSEIENELLESKLTLEDLLQSPVVHFAPPFGSIHPQSMHLIQKYYQSSRTITRGLNTKRTNRYFFHAHTVLDRTSLMDVERWVDKAIAENKWIILVYHHIDATEGIVSMSSKAFEDHLKMIQSKNISVKTLGQAHSSL
ncbi:MAG TPA: polysaccharide deacetylase family protein, partial [Rhabdochlamydiaceae bacterium]